jgi:hypothetical protein
MSTLPFTSGTAVSLAPAKPRARGFLHIVRHGAGPEAIYVLTYHRLARSSADGVILSVAKNSAPSRDVGAMNLSSLDGASPVAPQPDARPRPVLAESAHALINLLERIGVDFSLREVRGALEDILRLGSANIPDLWLSDEEMLEKGLVES